MEDGSQAERPERAGDQEGLDGDDQVEHRERIGHAADHLRPGQGGEDGIGGEARHG